MLSVDVSFVLKCCGSERDPTVQIGSDEKNHKTLPIHTSVLHAFLQEGFDDHNQAKPNDIILFETLLWGRAEWQKVE